MLSAFVASLFISYFIKDISFLGIKLTAYNLPENLASKKCFALKRLVFFLPPFFQHDAENGVNSFNIKLQIIKSIWLLPQDLTCVCFSKK